MQSASLHQCRGCTRINRGTMNADLQSRSTLRAWVLYMVSHPAYFYQATGWRMTDANVAMIATELFWDDVRLGRVRVPHSRKNNRAVGVKAIADLLGTSCKMVKWHHARGLTQGKYERWKTPIYMDGNILWGYNRRLIRWAIARGIGKYAKQSVSEGKQKARCLQAQRTQAGLRPALAKGEGKQGEAIPSVRTMSSSRAHCAGGRSTPQGRQPNEQ